MPTGMESTVKLRIGKYLLTGVIFGGVTFKLGEETGVDIAGTDILLFDRLSIVKKIIEDHGGKIWATSKLGIGTEIHFVLRKISGDAQQMSIEMRDVPRSAGCADETEENTIRVVILKTHNRRN